MRTIALFAVVGGIALATCGTASSRQAPDPLEGYFGNTLVCAGGSNGNDLCHTWIERDGTFINIDPGGMHKGHYTRGPRRADGKTPLCYFYDSLRLVIPKELMGPPSGGKPGAGGGPPPPGPGGVICRTSNFRTTCTRYDNESGLSDSDRVKLHWTIAERFHNGMCYPLAEKKAGDTWFEEDDPMPSQNGIDKLFLIKGHH